MDILNFAFVQSLFSSTYPLLKASWPLWVFVFMFFLIKLGCKLYKKYKHTKAGMDKIDVMDGKTFENFLASLFQRKGYSVKQVGSSIGDYGADLVISKDGHIIAVQAKRHKSVIGVGAVREALGSIKMYKCSSGMVVTNSYFTKQAEKLANVNKIDLWDRNILANQIKTNKTNSQA